MHKPIQRLQRLFTRFLLISGVASIVILYCLLFTQFGLNFIYNYYTKGQHNTFKINSLSGNLLGPIVAKHLTYHDNTNKLDITLDEVRIDWSLRHLFTKGIIHINYIHTNSAVIKYYDNNKPFDLNDYLILKNRTLPIPNNFNYATLRLPVQFTIDNIKCTNVAIISNNFTQTINELNLNIIQDANHWQIKNLIINAPNLQIIASGLIKSANDILKAKLDLHKLHIHYVDKDLIQRNINLTGSLSAKIDFKQNISRFRLSNINGLWLDEQFALESELIFKDTTIEHIDIKGAIEHNNFFINATTEPKLNASWKLDIPALDKLFKSYPGVINLSGEIINKNNIDSVTAQTTISIKTLLPKFALSINGSSAKLNNKLTLNKGGLYIATEFVATSELPNNWELNFKNSTLLIHEVTSFKLKENSKIKWLNSNIIFSDFCLANQQSNTCLNANIDQDFNWTAAIEAKEMSLELFSNLLPGNIVMNGVIDLHSNLQGSGLKVSQLTTDLKVDELHLRYEDIGDDIYNIHLKHGDMQIDLNKDLDIKTTLNFNEHNKITSNLHFNLNSSSLKDYDIPIIGELNLDLQSIDSIYHAYKNKTNSGAIKANILLSGTTNNPIIKNNLILTNLDMHMGYLKTNLKLDKLIMKDLGNNHGTINGTGLLGTGKFVLTGNTNYTKNAFGGKINLSGNNLSLINTHRYQIIASPEVKVELIKDNLNIAGTININSATINWNDDISSITSSDDIEFIDENKTSLLFHLHTTLDLLIPNDIKFEGYNLTAFLSGNLKIKSSPNITALATGSLILKRGTYILYGKTFDLDEGKLFFPGNSIYKPHIDVSANKIINPTSSVDNPLLGSSREIKVGAKLTNTLDKPKIKLFSTPDLPENDILSYLTIGKSAQEASRNVMLTAMQQAASILLAQKSKQATALAQANTTKDKKKYSDLHLFDSIKLVEKNNFLEGTITKNTEFENILSNVNLIISNKLAKFLTLELELSSGTDSTVRIKYDLNKNVTLQTSSSLKGAGLDILFNKETD